MTAQQSESGRALAGRFRAGRGALRRAATGCVVAALVVAGGAFTGDLLSRSDPRLRQPAPPDPSVVHSRDLSSYVMFALDWLVLKGDDSSDYGWLRGGNVGVNRAGRVNGDARLRMCQGPGDGLAIQMDEGSQVVADTANIARACVMWDVLVGYCASDWRNSAPSTANCGIVKPRARSVTFKRWYGGPYDDGAGDPELIPDTAAPGGLQAQLAANGFERHPSFRCNAAMPTTTMGPGTGLTSLAPGVYGNLRVVGRGARLGPGTYTFCNVSFDRYSGLLLDPATVVNVDGSLSMPDSDFGTESAKTAKVTVKGSVAFGRGSSFNGHLWAPYATVRLGHRTVINGKLWAHSFQSDRGIRLNTNHVPEEPSTTTTEPPSTTTSTTTSTSTSTSTSTTTSTTTTAPPSTTTSTTAATTTTSSTSTPTTRPDN